MTDAIRGFYSVFMAGRAGEAVAVIAIANDTICGAAMDGTTFDGALRAIRDGHAVQLKVAVPASGHLIQDVAVGPAGLAYETEFVLPEDFSTRDYVAVQTPYGPVNARFRRLRGIA